MDQSKGAAEDFTYTGHYYDRPTGLNLARYRGYDPNLGRWISRDPLGIAGGFNLYGYANNNSVRYFDPSGRLPMDGTTTDQFIQSGPDAPLLAGFAGIMVLLHEYAPSLAYVLDAGLFVKSEKDLALLGFLGNPSGGMCGGAAAEAEPLASFGPNTVGAGQRTPLVLQRGGNTIRASTADGLNEYAGTNLSRREWGRFVEQLKQEHGLPPNHHATIYDNGNYADDAGNIIGNLLEYLP